jgi:serine/threonine protein kinase
LNEKFKKKGQRVTEVGILFVACTHAAKFELGLTLGFAFQRANILKEVSIMRGLNHQSIIKLLSFTESDEHYFLVLERESAFALGALRI